MKLYIFLLIDVTAFQFMGICVIVNVKIESFNFFLNVNVTIEKTVAKIQVTQCIITRRNNSYNYHNFFFKSSSLLTLSKKKKEFKTLAYSETSSVIRSHPELRQPREKAEARARSSSWELYVCMHAPINRCAEASGDRGSCAQAWNISRPAAASTESCGRVNEPVYARVLLFPGARRCDWRGILACEYYILYVFLGNDVECSLSLFVRLLFVCVYVDVEFVDQLIITAILCFRE